MSEANEPFTTDNHQLNMFWLLTNPEKTLGSVYHDAGSCWMLIEEFRKYFSSLSNEIVYLGSQLNIIRNSMTETIVGNPEEQARIAVAGLAARAHSDDGEIL